jgi:hypothetical protein
MKKKEFRKRYLHIFQSQIRNDLDFVVATDLKLYYIYIFKQTTIQREQKVYSFF